MDKPPSDQLELFKSLPRAKAKLFRSANGPDLSYWRLPSDKYRVELSDGALIDITKQSPGRSGHPRLYTKIPGSGQDIVQARNLKTILAQIALLDHIRTLNKSIQIKLKQQDDAANTLSDLAKDDHAALEEENARLLAELESLRNHRQKSRRWVNTVALEWALDQELPPGIKVVLITFASHSDEHGESWPSLKGIAEKCKMARETVRAAIGFLVASKLLIDTGKRAGSTHQVKIYRLPAIDVEEVAVTTPLKGAAKGRQSGSQGVAVTTPNNDNEQEQHNHHGSDESITLGTSLPLVSSNEGSTSDPASKSSNFVEGHHHQSHSARQHTKWPEFVTWCASQKGKPAKDGRVHDGIPTEKGFWKWMSGQIREWRNKQSQIDGFELDGKFLTKEEANRIAADNARLLDEGRFRPARKMQTSDGTWWIEDESGAVISSSFLSPKR